MKNNLDSLARPFKRLKIRIEKNTNINKNKNLTCSQNFWHKIWQPLVFVNGDTSNTSFYATIPVKGRIDGPQKGRRWITVQLVQWMRSQSVKPEKHLLNINLSPLVLCPLLLQSQDHHQCTVHLQRPLSLYFVDCPQCLINLYCF